MFKENTIEGRGNLTVITAFVDEGQGFLFSFLSCLLNRVISEDLYAGKNDAKYKLLTALYVAICVCVCVFVCAYSDIIICVALASPSPLPSPFQSEAASQAPALKGPRCFA